MNYNLFVLILFIATINYGECNYRFKRISNDIPIDKSNSTAIAVNNVTIIADRGNTTTATTTTISSLTHDNQTQIEKIVTEKRSSEKKIHLSQNIKNSPNENNNKDDVGKRGRSFAKREQRNFMKLNRKILSNNSSMQRDTGHQILLKRAGNNNSNSSINNKDIKNNTIPIKKSQESQQIQQQQSPVPPIIISARELKLLHSIDPELFNELFHSKEIAKYNVKKSVKSDLNNDSGRSSGNDNTGGSGGGGNGSGSGNNINMMQPNKQHIREIHNYNHRNDKDEISTSISNPSSSSSQAYEQHFNPYTKWLQRRSPIQSAFEEMMEKIANLDEQNANDYIEQQLPLLFERAAMAAASAVKQQEEQQQQQQLSSSSSYCPMHAINRMRESFDSDEDDADIIDGYGGGGNTSTNQKIVQVCTCHLMRKQPERY